MKKQIFSITLAVMMLAITLALLIPVSSTATDPEPSKYVVYLSDYMKEHPNAYTAAVGWAELGIDQGVTSGGNASLLKKAYAEGGNILWKKQYDKGICAHANSTVKINIEGQNFARFTADIGINYADGNVGNWSGISNADANYSAQIKTASGETTEIFSTYVTGLQEIVKADFAIPANAVELILITDAGSSNNSDHTAWFDAKFYLAEEANDSYFVYASDFYDAHSNDGLVFASTGYGSLGINAGVSNSGGLSTVYAELLDNAPAGKGWPIIRDASGNYVADRSNSSSYIQNHYEKGLVAHADSIITFNVEGQNFGKFQADIGINFQNSGYNYAANSKFIVKLTDAAGVESVAYESFYRTVYDGALPISVDIPDGTKTVTLVTEYDRAVDIQNSSAHSGWFDAKFVYNDAAHTAPRGIEAVTDSAIVTESAPIKIKTSMVSMIGIKTDLSEGIRYSVSDPSVLSVSNDGTVTALASGKATVTVSYQGYSDTVSLIAITSASSDSAWTATSPDGSLTVALFNDESTGPSYYAVKNGQLVMNESALGMLTDVADFTSGLSFSSVKTERQENKYNPISGKTSSVDQPGNLTTVTFTKGDFYFDIVLAAYDEGFAYRYAVNAIDGSTGTMIVSEEASSFNLFADTTLWTQYIDPKVYDPDEKEAIYEVYCYESGYNPATAAKNLTVGSYHAMPALAKVTDDCYLLISEADLFGDRYAGSCFKAVGNNTLKLNWAPMVYEGESVTTEYGFTSPYRMVIVGSLAELVESTLTDTLNPAAEGDYSWVEPGYTAWMWLTEGYSGQYNPDVIKEYIDLASEMGWKYLILDDGWQPSHFNPYSGFYDHTAELVEYASQKNVKLIAWFYSREIRVNPDGSYDLSFLDDYKEIGMAGVKADFFDSETPEKLDLYEAIYKKCAELQLIVNCHGANKPTGELRTYPHLINREAAKTREYGALYASDATVWAFARNVIGAVDATPSVTPASLSSAGMIAEFILVESGMPCVVASPEQLYASDAYYFLRNMPAAWDETKLVEGYPGEYAMIARRSGNCWYMGGVTTASKTVTPSLSFLGEGEYTAIILKDGGNSDETILETVKVNKNSTLSLDLLNNGGVAVKFIPDEEMVEIEQLRFEQKEYALEEERVLEITATIMPENATFPILNYTVADETVARINSTTGEITALKPGYTTVRATVFGKPEVYAEYSLFVYDSGYDIAPVWSVVNPNASKPAVTSYKTPYSITMPSLTGDTIVQTKPQNIWLIESADSFEITVKVSGNLGSNYETAALCAFDDFGNIVIMSRRFHGGLGGNIFCLATHDGGYNEKCTSDVNKTDDAYLKLTLQNGVFTGYYSYNGTDWTVLSETITNTAVSGSENLRVGLYYSTGTPIVNNTVTFSDFSYNGTPVSFYTESADNALLAVKQADEALTLVRGSNATVDVVKYYSDGSKITEKIALDTGALAEMPIGINTLNVTVEGIACVLTFTLTEGHRYDINRDNTVDISDVTLLLDYLAGGTLPEGISPDLNNDQTEDISDVTILLDYLSEN